MKRHIDRSVINLITLIGSRISVHDMTFENEAEAAFKIHNSGSFSKGVLCRQENCKV